MRHAATALLFCLLVLAAPSQGRAGDYEAALQTWTSHEDVARWLEGNFRFDRARLATILDRTRQSGPAGLLARRAEGTFEAGSGYCTDAANFAVTSLNRINPAYQAQYIFIKNRFGQPHHWVAGFRLDGKIMVMDFGAGPDWAPMIGVHGPYGSLAEYQTFLSGLGISGFAPESVEWRRVFPGRED